MTFHGRAAFLCLMIPVFLVPTFALSQFTREWAVTYDGTIRDTIGAVFYSADYLQAMLVDRDGNVILAGETNPAPFLYSLTTVKYSPQGKKLWKNDVVLWDSPVESDVQMATDGKGNIFLAYGGVVEDSAGWIVLRYSPNGKLTRTFIFPLMNDIMDAPQAIAVDTCGNIILTGKTNTGGLQWDCATMKADSTGNLLWSKLYNSGGWDDGLEMCLDDSNNILVAAVGAGFGTDDDMVTLKYDGDGNLRWAKDYNGGGHEWTDDWPVSIETDAQTNVYVTGYSQPSPSAPYGIVTLKYSPDGTEMWCRRIEDALVGGYSFSSHNVMHVDEGGSVYLTGCTFSTGSQELLTCRYSTDGSLLWKTLYPGNGAGDDLGKGITITPSGRVIVAGEVYQAGERYSALLCYDTTGSIIGTDIYYGKANLEKFAYSVALSPDGSIYFSGIDCDWATAFDFLLIKYSFTVTEVAPIHGLPLPDAFALGQNYPNPFNPSTTIRYGLPVHSRVSLSVFNTLGQEVATLVQSEQEAGYHEVRFDGSGLSSGVYYYRLKAGDFVQTKKLLLLR